MQKTFTFVKKKRCLKLTFLLPEELPNRINSGDIFRSFYAIPLRSFRMPHYKAGERRYRWSGQKQTTQ